MLNDETKFSPRHWRACVVDARHIDGVNGETVFVRRTFRWTRPTVISLQEIVVGVSSAAGEIGLRTTRILRKRGRGRRNVVNYAVNKFIVPCVAASSSTRESAAILCRHRREMRRRSVRVVRLVFYPRIYRDPVYFPRFAPIIRE